MSAREAFLERVRQAVANGNRAGLTSGLPERGSVGYQGAGQDPLAWFCAELQKAGGYPHVAADPEAAWQVMRDVVRAKAARNILVGLGMMIERLDLAGRLAREGFAVTTVDTLQKPDARDACFAADIGVSNVEHLVAETGSMVMASGPLDPRSLSLLPPTHIAVADRKQLVADLFDLFGLYSPASDLPSCLTLITGPSKTGDIELRLVTGVHGPGEIHVIVCTW